MLTRRALLKGAALSAGALIRMDAGAFDVAAQEVSATAVRLLFLPRASAAPRHVPDDGALVRQEWPQRAVHRAARPGISNLEVEVAQDLAVRVRSGAQLVQQLRADPNAGTLSFLLGHGPLLGLGEGGPQFDRRGSIDEMRNGQEGYRLRTHGGRVPIQWLVGTDGWGI